LGQVLQLDERIENSRYRLQRGKEQGQRLVPAAEGGHGYVYDVARGQLEVPCGTVHDGRRIDDDELPAVSAAANDVNVREVTLKTLGLAEAHTGESLQKVQVAISERNGTSARIAPGYPSENERLIVLMIQHDHDVAALEADVLA
jgi:hypothetical protein